MAVALRNSFGPLDGAVHAPAAMDLRRQYLFGPVVDFVCLGGGSMLILVALVRLFDVDVAESSAITLAAASIINHPHFAHSYQLFYGGYWSKLKASSGIALVRYVVAGLIVPLALGIFFVVCIVAKSPEWLGLGVNIMIFFVGWHYVKQGYGMAALDSALKKKHYSLAEKKMLLRNAYAVWILSWAHVVSANSERSNQYFGIPYHGISLPSWVLVSLAAVAVVTSLDVLMWFFRRLYGGKGLALNGFLAYCVSLYLWLLWRNPVFLLWFPMLHSLQYLVVVARFEVNREWSSAASVRPSLRVGLFYAIGVLLGFLGFWGLPDFLNRSVAFDKGVFGSSVFLCMFWIFINVHHYFIDSVMWRRGNSDVSRYLFQSGALGRPA